MRSTWLVAMILILAAGCAGPAPASVPAATSQPDIANPASVYCKQQGNQLEIRTAADGSQSGVCIFPDGSACDEWAYYRGECEPAGTGQSQLSATGIPTARPVDPAGYQGWWTYTHAVYGFSIMLPEDWVAEEITGSDPAMNGHTLSLHPSVAGSNAAENIRMAFRKVGEDARLWPTGVGQGAFIQQGTLEVGGQPAVRMLLVCPSGEVTSIWYHQVEGQPNVRLGALEFGFIFSGSPTHCEPGYSLGGKVQWLGEMIIASLKVQ